MKALLFVCDGMADRPLKQLGGRTPLEAAKKPNMDALAKRGVCGLLDPIAPGVRVGSDTTHLALLGYNPYEVYTGRGPFEAAGVGLELKKGDIAFRCNFATVDNNLVILDRRAGRISEDEDKQELEKAINSIGLDRAEVIFKASAGHRGVLVFRGDNLSCAVSDSDPHVAGEKVKKALPLDSSAEAKKTAAMVNEFSQKVYETLKNHRVNTDREKKGKPPANMLLLRGCGVAPELQPFSEKYKLKAACIATTAIIKGIARLAQIDVLEPAQDYSKRIKQALDALKTYDFLLVNIKEPDEAAHDNSAKKKIKLIEEIDAALKPLLKFCENNYLVLLSDHTTSTSFGDHTGDAVPVLICGPEVRIDSVNKFDERSVAKGGLNRIQGADIMNILIDLMNKSEKFGA